MKKRQNYFFSKLDAYCQREIMQKLIFENHQCFDEITYYFKITWLEIFLFNKHNKQY